MTNEIAVKTDLGVNLTPAKIEFAGYEALKDEVVRYVEKYQDIVFTDEQIKDAKAVQAEMNKLTKQIDDARKKVKRDYNKPLDEFEKDIRFLTNLINDVKTPISEGIKAFDDKEREAKHQKVNELIEHLVENKEGIEKIDIVFAAAWLNKTKSMADIEKDIIVQINNLQEAKVMLRGAIAAVESLCKALELEPYAWVELLKQGNSVESVTQRIEQAGATQKAEREAKAKQEAEAQNKEQENQRTQNEQQIEQQPEPFKKERLYISEIQICGTNAQFHAVNNYMKQIGVTVKSLGKTKAVD